MVKNECSTNDKLKNEGLRIWESVLPTNEELSSIYSCNQSLVSLTETKYHARIREKIFYVAKNIEISFSDNLSAFVAAELIYSQLQSLASERSDLTWKVFCNSARKFLMTLLEESVIRNQDLCLLATAICNEFKRVTNSWENKRFTSFQPFFGGFGLFTVIIFIKIVIGHFF